MLYCCLMKLHRQGAAQRDKALKHGIAGIVARAAAAVYCVAATALPFAAHLLCGALRRGAWCIGAGLRATVGATVAVIVAVVLCNAAVTVQSCQSTAGDSDVTSMGHAC